MLFSVATDALGPTDAQSCCLLLQLMSVRAHKCPQPKGLQPLMLWMWPCLPTCIPICLKSTVQQTCLALLFKLPILCKPLGLLTSPTLPLGPPPSPLQLHAAAAHTPLPAQPRPGTGRGRHQTATAGKAHPCCPWEGVSACKKHAANITLSAGHTIHLWAMPFSKDRTLPMGHTTVSGSHHSIGHTTLYAPHQLPSDTPHSMHHTNFPVTHHSLCTIPTSQ